MAGWTRDCSIYCLVNAGTLSGLQNIGYAKRFEVKPYLLGAFEKKRNKSATFPNKAGGDLNVNLTPTLKLNLTVNTDFAQVEADRIPVNLSRFSLFYPEKREFFLEGYQNYQFELGNDNQVFYTRKIGIENFRSVPVIAGARLFGKLGANNIGLLNIQTGSASNIASTNNTIVRYKRDIGNQSYIGGIFTSKNSKDINNQVVGLDGAYSTAHFLKNKNLVISGLATESFDKGIHENDNYAWRFFIDYPNDFIDHFIGISSVQQNYKPELGFLNRKNFDNLTWNFRINPRWFQKWGINQMLLKPWEFSLYRTHTTRELESFYNESSPLGFLTKSGESFEFNLQQIFERLDTTFALTDSIQFIKGKYWMYRKEVQFGTFPGRKYWAHVSYNWGNFYTGKIATIETSVGINVNKHLNFKTDFNHNNITISSGHFSTDELAEYMNYAFNPKVEMTFFLQWNSLDDLLFGNLRLHWIPKIGSDMYVVFNRQYDQLDKFKFSEPQIVSGAIKFVGRFTF